MCGCTYSFCSFFDLLREEKEEPSGAPSSLARRRRRIDSLSLTLLVENFYSTYMVVSQLHVAPELALTLFTRAERPKIGRAHV